MHELLPTGPRPYFDTRVAPGGYAWWYVDALSDDGERALVAIFFIGSVFSPSYARRLRRGEEARAEEHLAVNLALYERGKQGLWVMSEYGAAALGETSDERLGLGRTVLERRAHGGLTIHLVERAAPFLLSLAGLGARVEGTIEIEPACAPLPEVELSETEGFRHWWRVPVPRARVRARFSRPALDFEGTGYHDINRGDSRLEHSFAHWSWARFHTDDRVVIMYATQDHEGAARGVLVDARDGASPAQRAPRELAGRPEARTVKAGWGLTMPPGFTVGPLRCEAARRLDVAPFYARYLATLVEDGQPGPRGLGEYLDLDRFRPPGVQFLLRFKTRREG